VAECILDKLVTPSRAEFNNSSLFDLPTREVGCGRRVECPLPSDYAQQYEHPGHNIQYLDRVITVGWEIAAPQKHEQGG